MLICSLARKATEILQSSTPISSDMKLKRIVKIISFIKIVSFLLLLFI